MNFALILLDLNKFKPINDDYGHHEGDFALKSFASVMQDAFREVDIIGRIGGDEFVVFLTDTDNEKLESILARFSDLVNQANVQNAKPYNIEFSAGVVHFPHDCELSLEQMIQQADDAMYEQKKGRER